MNKFKITVIALLFILLSGMIFTTNTSAAAHKKIILNKKTLSLQKNKKYTLRLKGVKKKKVKWRSNKKRIVSVKKGKIIAKKRGKATVTASAFGRKYRCKISVFEKKNKYSDNTLSTIPDKGLFQNFSMFFTVTHVSGKNVYLASEINPNGATYILKMSNSLLLTFGVYPISEIDAKGIYGMTDFQMSAGKRLKIVNPTVLPSSKEAGKMKIANCTRVEFVRKGVWHTSLSVDKISDKILYMSENREGTYLGSFILHLGQNDILVLKNGKQLRINDIKIGDKVNILIDPFVSVTVPGIVYDCTRIHILE